MRAKRSYTTDKAKDAIGHDPDTLELLDMANLEEADTGVAGVIYVSTQQGSHGPRVKWYPSRPTSRTDDCLSVTIAATPRVFNHGLPKVLETRIADPLTRWVALNHGALLDFWQNGWRWTRGEVSDFFDHLQKV